MSYALALACVLSCYLIYRALEFTCQSLAHNHIRWFNCIGVHRVFGLPAVYTETHVHTAAELHLCLCKIVLSYIT